MLNHLILFRAAMTRSGELQSFHTKDAWSRSQAANCEPSRAVECRDCAASSTDISVPAGPAGSRVFPFPQNLSRLRRAEISIRPAREQKRSGPAEIVWLRRRA